MSLKLNQLTFQLVPYGFVNHIEKLCMLYICMQIFQNVEVKKSVWKQSKAYESVVIAQRISWMRTKLPTEWLWLQQCEKDIRLTSTAKSACAAPPIMFGTKLRCPGASRIVKCFFSVSKYALPTSTVFPLSLSSWLVSNAHDRYLQISQDQNILFSHFFSNAKKTIQQPRRVTQVWVLTLSQHFSNFKSQLQKKLYCHKKFRHTPHKLWKIKVSNDLYFCCWKFVYVINYDNLCKLYSQIYIFC